MSEFFKWLSDNWGGIALCLFIISEILPFIKGVKSNGLSEALVVLFKNLSNRGG